MIHVIGTESEVYCFILGELKDPKHFNYVEEIVEAFRKNSLSEDVKNAIEN